MITEITTQQFDKNRLEQKKKKSWPLVYVSTPNYEDYRYPFDENQSEKHFFCH